MLSLLEHDFVISLALELIAHGKIEALEINFKSVLK